jgi:phage/plasmid primase-like uncharacterized protein
MKTVETEQEDQSAKEAAELSAQTESKERLNGLAEWKAEANRLNRELATAQADCAKYASRIVEHLRRNDDLVGEIAAAQADLKQQKILIAAYQEGLELNQQDLVKRVIEQKAELESLKAVNRSLAPCGHLERFSTAGERSYCALCRLTTAQAEIERIKQEATAWRKLTMDKAEVEIAALKKELGR